jgi:hypothetical protein
MSQDLKNMASRMFSILSGSVSECTFVNLILKHYGTKKLNSGTYKCLRFRVK